MFLLKILENVFGISNILILLSSGTIVGICVVLALSWNFTIYNKNRVKEIKLNGKKGEAQIIKLQTFEEWNFSHKRSWIIDYGYDKIATMVLSYQGGLIRIGLIRVNKAYKILKLLLEPYPMKTANKICVNIYEYKNLIYADLENLKIERINGYEEAKNIINNIYKKGE